MIQNVGGVSAPSFLFKHKEGDVFMLTMREIRGKRFYCKLDTFTQVVYLKRLLKHYRIFDKCNIEYTVVDNFWFVWFTDIPTEIIDKKSFQNTWNKIKREAKNS